MRRIHKAIAGAAIALVALTGCASDADRASQNTSTAAEAFEVQRQISGYNNVTDELIFLVEGRCSIEIRGAEGRQVLETMCKHGPEDFRKHYLGAADQTTWIAEQMAPIDVSEYNTRIILKPENILPTIELDTSGGDE